VFSFLFSVIKMKCLVVSCKKFPQFEVMHSKCLPEAGYNGTGQLQVGSAATKQFGLGCSCRGTVLFV